MFQQYKVCPICDTPAHRNATLCSTCGATLSNVESLREGAESRTITLGYEHRYGETDLAEATVRWKGGTYLFGALVTALTLVCAGIALSAGLRLANPSGTSSSSATPLTLVPTRGEEPVGVNTNTPRPTLNLPTVTPAPPTSTFTETAEPTPTAGPCMQQVVEGDDLYALVSRCGHLHYEDIINQVVEINELADPSRIQIGQTLEIPWPTPTLDPNAVVTEEVSSTEETSSLGIASAGNVGMSNEEVFAGLSPAPTNTLQPGVMWHQVLKDENIIVIAYQYGANVEILSQLNPEIPFAQCDFSLDTGGEACTVFLAEGQLVRVPAPTPTPTLSPTPSGSETPTPTATPTFNAPSALSPDERQTFRQDEIITLRWVASGTLAAGQAYRVEVTDRATGSYFTANTQELFFIIPEGWQGQDDQRHEYLWRVSVIQTDDPNNPIYTTEARTFRWEGRGDS